MTHAKLLLTAGLLCGLPGCFSTHDPGSVAEYEYSGTLTLEWTINGSTDPDQCNQSVATDLDVVVSTPDGEIIGEFLQPCGDGTTTIELAPGAYVADAALLDGAGYSRTTLVNVNPFVIDSDTDLWILLDFPASSFY